MESDRNRFYTSRVINDLDNQIRASTCNANRNVLFARKAFTLARFSLVQEANDIIRDLRQINTTFETRLSAWIMFAEGVIEHSAHLDIAKAKDRVIRAHLVGQVANDPTLAGTSAAWLAFFCFQQSKYLEAKEYMEKAFSWTKNEDREGRARACMVMGMGFLYSGETNKGKAWMQLARDNAVKSGDIAMQNIIFYNSSAYQTAQLTLLDCTTGVSPDEIKFALMSAQSASNFNTALGIANQISMLPIQRAELLTIEKKWQEAADIFDKFIDKAKVDGQSAVVPKYIAQRAWCRANLGDSIASKLDIAQANALSGQCPDPDDLAVLHLRLSACAELLGDAVLASNERELGDKHLLSYREQQAVVMAYFDEVAKSFPQK